MTKHVKRFELQYVFYHVKTILNKLMVALRNALVFVE